MVREVYDITAGELFYEIIEDQTATGSVPAAEEPNGGDDDMVRSRSLINGGDRRNRFFYSASVLLHIFTACLPSYLPTRTPGTT